MYPVQNADGGSVLQTARNYPIDAETVIDAGAVVKLSGGKVVLAAAAETGAILGIAAEFHSGKEDALNLRANGEWIRVCDNPTLIFECAAPTIKAGLRAALRPSCRRPATWTRPPRTTHSTTRSLY